MYLLFLDLLTVVCSHNTACISFLQLYISTILTGVRQADDCSVFCPVNVKEIMYLCTCVSR